MASEVSNSSKNSLTIKDVLTQRKTQLVNYSNKKSGTPIRDSRFDLLYAGVGASRVRDIFNQAKEKSPCIVFIDEIDAIGRHRGRPQSGYSSTG